MATLVNRDIIVRNPDGIAVLARVRGQNIEGGWMKCLSADGEEFMAQASDFVRVANLPLDYALLDRSDAVNLARNIRETDNIENVTRKGWLSLVDAVLRMDAALRRVNG